MRSFFYASPSSPYHRVTVSCITITYETLNWIFTWINHIALNFQILYTVKEKVLFSNCIYKTIVITIIINIIRDVTHRNNYIVAHKLI